MDPQLIRIQAGNADLLCCIAGEVFDHPLDPDRLREFLSDEGHVLIVACLDRQVIGQIVAVRHRHPDAAPDLYIENLGVAPAFRRRGIASQLIAMAREVARAMGCRATWLATEADNAAARALYARAGAREETVLMLSFDAD